MTEEKFDDLDAIERELEEVRKMVEEQKQNVDELTGIRKEIEAEMEDVFGIELPELDASLAAVADDYVGDMEELEKRLAQDDRARAEYDEAMRKFEPLKKRGDAIRQSFARTVQESRQVLAEIDAAEKAGKPLPLRRVK